MYPCYAVLLRLNSAIVKREDVMPVVSGLFCRPIKSCESIRCQRVRVSRYGIEPDCRYAVVDFQNKIVTRREHPRLVRIRVAVHERFGSSVVEIRVPSNRSGVEVVAISLDESLPRQASVKVRVWNNTCLAEDQGDDVADLLTGFLGISCRLVRKCDEDSRVVKVRPSGVPVEIAFADAYPFLVISQASLDDLNRRIGSPAYQVGMEVFRPNVVIDGCSRPYGEESWKKIKIGDVVLEAVKLCSRCVVTTQDPLTGISRGNEPLRTLAGYKKADNGIPVFGMYYNHLTWGTMAIGNQVVILE
jgi:uncharacterized protein